MLALRGATTSTPSSSGGTFFLKSKVNICFYFRGYVFGRAGRGRRANFLLEFQFYSCADGRVECDLGRQRALPVPLPHEPLTHTTRWWLRRQRRRPGAHCRGWHSFRGRTRRCRRRRHQGGFGRLPVLRSRRRICRRRLRRRRRIARGWGLCASKESRPRTCKVPPRRTFPSQMALPNAI